MNHGGRASRGLENRRMSRDAHIWNASVFLTLDNYTRVLRNVL